MAEPLTNIGTTRPPRKGPAGPYSFRPAGLGPLAPAAPPDALPVARRLDEGPGEQYVTPDPLWISRWQPSATPPDKPRPWVTGYRWWVGGSKYQTWGPVPFYRIDLMWKNHAHAYHGIPRDLWEEFRHLKTSVGRWFHQKILGPNWRPGAGSLWPDFPL